MVEEHKMSDSGTLPIQVNQGVVKHLSLGLYRNFALSIKELISNSYDAGATEVKIKLDLKNGKIIIRDNGRGMDLTQFEKEYLHIGYWKQPAKSVDKLGRLRVGTFGIGFLATLPYCKIMRVITKKRGGNKTIEANINAENFFREGAWSISEEEVPYTIYDSDLPKNEGETIIILEGIKPQVAEDLKREVRGKRSIEHSGFEKFRWTLCQYAPIQFSLNRKDLRDFFDDPERTPMSLWLDGEELFRNVPEGARILEKDEENFGDVSIKYIIMTPYKTVKPEEARGLQVRLRDVAIGFPRDFDVTKLSRVLGKLNFICGEVHITKGLDNTLMVDRDSFNYTQEVAEMYKFFQRKLTQWDKKLYEWADNDKKVYGALGDLKNNDKHNDKLIEDLKKAKVLHFAKERLRLPKTQITKTKKTKPGIPSKKIVDALSETKKKEYTVIPKKGKISADKPPIEVLPEKKSIIVHKEHPSFVETISIYKKEFKVDYDLGEFANTPHLICKVYDKENKVVFNTSHPLFNSKLSDEIIKRLSLGIVLTLKDLENGENLILKLNRLLEDTFEG